MGLDTNTGTIVVNGQRTTAPTVNSYDPVGFGQLVQLQPIRNISTPPLAGQTSGVIGQNSYPEEVGGYGTAGNNVLATQAANANPWNLRVSSTPWAVILLLLSVALLAAVHWRKTTLAGFSENAHLADAREGGSASV